jgi:AraC-like DNA-binding protein
MSENTLDFKINGNKNMDILPGVHGNFITQKNSLFSGGITFTVLSDYGEMLFQCISARDFSIWLSMYRMKQTACLSAEANAPSLETMHLLEGDIDFSPDGIQGPVTMKSSHWQMMGLPYVRNEVVLPAGCRLTTLDIHVDPNYLQRLSPYFPALDQFLDKTSAGRSATLINNPAAISHRVKSLIGDLFDSRSSVDLQNLFLERHMMDWLASNLESSFTVPSNTLKISANEEKKLREVLELMMTNLGKSLLISDLAQEAHMNEYKFKCAFKTLFKLPVHKYLMEERMKKAKVMLEEGSLTLFEIAILCGYQSQAAFSKEFRKKYGVAPSFYLKK